MFGTDNWASHQQFVDALEQEGSKEAEHLAKEIALHLPITEQILAWLDLKPGGGRLARLGEKVYAVVTNHHFMVVITGRDNRGPSIRIESAPIGRLRSVFTHAHQDGSGAVTLDFAGPLFAFHSTVERSDVTFQMNRGWPSEEVTRFLGAVASVRK